MTRNAPTRCCPSEAKAEIQFRVVIRRCYEQSLTDPFSRKFKIAQLMRRRWEFGVYKYSDKLDRRQHLPQQTKPFQLHLTGPKGKTCDVAVRSVEAGNDTGLDWVVSHPKDDWDRRSCLLGGESRNITTDTNKDGNFSADQIGRQSWQPIVIAMGPTELNRDSLAFDKARFG